MKNRILRRRPNFGGFPLEATLLLFVVAAVIMPARHARAGAYGGAYGPGVVPWPAGKVPYVWDASVPANFRPAYLAALKEWELAANIQFSQRVAEPTYLTLKYDALAPFGGYDAGTRTLTNITLSRANICHESGHALGLQHEHSRSDRNTYVTVHLAAISPAAQPKFALDPTLNLFGTYDYESVMHYGRMDYADPPGGSSITPNAPNDLLYFNRLGGATPTPGDFATLAHLYGSGPTLSPIVTNTNDTGPGSLRAAIYYANQHPGTTITFNIPNSDPGFSGGVYTIRLTGNLPALTATGTSIDASTQPLYAGTPIVALSGEDLVLPESGFVNGITILGSNSTVRGLAMYGFSWNGVGILHPGASNNHIESCYIGIKPNGTTPIPNALQGILISDGASTNSVGSNPPNVISGNHEYGVLIIDSTTTGNRVQGNRIGTNANGTAAIPNAKSGVGIWGGAHGTLIGGVASAAERNIISGNTEYGVWISDIATTPNTIQDNYIGTNAAGTGAVPNQSGGIILTGGTHDNVVGPDNVLSGNVSAGLWITGAHSNRIIDNIVGLNAAGNAALPNSVAGIYILDFAQDNIVSGNVLSGNSSEGVRIADANTTGNWIYKNLVGTDASGTSAIGNGFAGLTIFNGATGNWLDANRVAGNSQYGIVIGDAGTSNNFVRGNSVGVGANFAPLGNGFAGVALWGGCTSDVIGLATPGWANIIAHNGSYGIVLFDPLTTADHTFSGNSIFSNGFAGISLGGGNHNQAAPVLTSATRGVSDTHVEGSLASIPNTNFRIEFFASPSSESDSGQYFVGALASLATNPSGNANISVTLPIALPDGFEITATATRTTNGESSAFSPPVAAISSQPDTDGDGMPNAYETANGLNQNVDDGGLDKDGDGAVNLGEYYGGTDPQNPADRFRILAIEKSGDDLEITLATVPGRLYRLDQSGSLQTGSWDLTVPNFLATGTATTLIDQNSAELPRSFYKGSLLP